MASPRPRQVWGVGVLIACLSLLAIAVVAAEGHPLEGPSSSSALDVGGALQAVVVVVAFVAALGGLAIVVYAIAAAPKGARPTRPKVRRRWLSVILALMTSVAILLLLRSTRETSSSPDELGGAAAGRESDTGAAVSTAMWVLAALVAAGLVALVVATLMSRRMAARAEAPAATATPELLAAIDASIDDLEAEGSPRAAVLAAYARLLEGLEAYGLGREAAETPQHHLRRALAELPVRAGPAQHLVDLFLEARFSTHAIGPVERDAARAALVSVRNDLATAVEPVSEPVGGPS